MKEEKKEPNNTHKAFLLKAVLPLAKGLVMTWASSIIIATSIETEKYVVELFCPTFNLQAKTYPGLSRKLTSVAITITTSCTLNPTLINWS